MRGERRGKERRGRLLHCSSAGLYATADTTMSRALRVAPDVTYACMPVLCVHLFVVNAHGLLIGSISLDGGCHCHFRETVLAVFVRQMLAMYLCGNTHNMFVPQHPQHVCETTPTVMVGWRWFGRSGTSAAQWMNDWILSSTNPFCFRSKLLPHPSLIEEPHA